MYHIPNVLELKLFPNKILRPQGQCTTGRTWWSCTTNLMYCKSIFFELNPMTTRTIYHRSSSDRNFAIIRNHWIHLLRQLHQHLWSKLITCHFISIIPRKKSKTTKKITQCLCNGCDVMFPGTDRWKAHFKTSPQCKDKHFPCNHCHSRFCGFNSDALENNSIHQNPARGSMPPL